MTRGNFEKLIKCFQNDGVGDLCAIGVQRRDGERSSCCAKDIGEAFRGRARRIETMILPESCRQVGQSKIKQLLILDCLPTGVSNWASQLHDNRLAKGPESFRISLKRDLLRI
ncbi:hypothetical protein Fot_35820 [Forsythia ovata]|uniref:Uncharacterized protein n=1 Tax=Forsythia ovata TaxID=205694 RepID=A0ABD1SMM9_9LAMI